MFCSNCGKKINDNSRFCEFCGACFSNDEPLQQAQPMQGQRLQPAKKPFNKTLAVVIASIALVMWGLSVGDLLSDMSDNDAEIEDIASDSSGAGSSTGIGGYSSGNVGSRADDSDNSGGNERSASSPAAVTETEKPQETYTSDKTGNMFTVPEKGRTNILCNGTKEMTVPAQNAEVTITEYVKYDNIFSVYVDGFATGSECYIKFSMRSQNDWDAGTTYGIADLKDNDLDYIMQEGFFTSKGYNYSFSWEKYGNIFKDAQFTIIDFLPSTGEMKWYFYVEMSNGTTTCTVEGVAHTVAGEEAFSTESGGSEDNTSGSSGGGFAEPGERKCAVCNGSGKVDCKKCDNGFLQCPSCHGAQTYYSYAQKKDVVCPRCNGGGKIKCTASGCVGGMIRCTHCGGDGYN